ncbi:transferase hexapeptide repeat family protein [Paraburkholderia bryophila]|uniref:Phenylacetic acid degradation protein n=1 Tax=Paraburkholderia bryophila TaxID=420952 RepID=A0A329BMA5_9BURK|nr:transferase hexapeptide repeat family protein [Paraburkholderia bryophila]RAS23766.1 phenylacetic acid degradation protein [Paraburkholderia bryophila]
MALFEFNGKRPRVDPSAYVHPSAVLIGDVTIGACCYIAPFASLRGDFGAVVVERGSNVQDGCVLHTGVDNHCWLGVDSHVGHGAIVHGATLEPNTMIGMHAVVMDGVVVGEASIVAACAFVRKDWRVPPRVLVAGVPGRVARLLSDEEIRAKSSGTRVYQQLAADCLRTLREVV